MPVIKTTRECYEVRVGERGRCGSEWANIILQCWANNPSPENIARGVSTSYGGEIQINSSFGAWAYSWNACGSPFKQFLIGLNFDYIFTKFMGSSLDVFDGEASVKEVYKEIIERRRTNQINRKEARAVWSEVIFGINGSEVHSYGESMQEIARSMEERHPMHDYFADPMDWPRCTRYDYQAKGFWDKLWPEFTEALWLEIKPAAA